MCLIRLNLDVCRRGQLLLSMVYVQAKRARWHRQMRIAIASSQLLCAIVETRDTMPIEPHWPNVRAFEEFSVRILDSDDQRATGP